MKNIKHEMISADIVVVGTGGSGLSAALAAKEAGAKNIFVLEKAAKPGGNTFKSGCVFAVNSPLQKRLGINILADEVFRDKISHAEWRVDARLQRNWINHTGDIMAWLEAKGLEFKNLVVFQENAPRVTHEIKPGVPDYAGGQIIETLIKECLKLGIKFLYDARARKILLDNKGNVSGLLASRKDQSLTINTKSVVLATGGFGGNKEMLNKYFPRHGNLRAGSLPHITGDGLTMAEEIGAIVDDQLAILLLGPGHEGTRSLGLLFKRPEMMIVNKEGERFYDESANLYYNPDDISNTVDRQRDKTCYALLDSGTKQYYLQNKETLFGVEAIQVNASWKETIDSDFQKDSREGKALVTDSLDEIAGFIGAKPEVLKATVDQYNSFCKNGYDADFIKDKKYLRRLSRPPYYAITGSQFFNTTFGGIKINHHTEVLNQQDVPINGLYAAGDNAGSWAPATYCHKYPGSAVSFALYSGFTAGKNAAQYVSE